MASGHGGRRAGAGRPAGSGWRPSVAALREDAIVQMQRIVGSGDDPLQFVVGMVADESLDVQTRLGAASIVLPYLYPRLSATQVAATHITATVDPAQLQAMLLERIARLAPAPAANSDGEKIAEKVAS